MTDHATNAGTRGDDLLSHLRIGRLSRGDFRLGEGGPLVSRWYIGSPFSSSDYDELRRCSAQSVLTSNVIQVSEQHAAWVLGVQAGATLHRLFVLLVGSTVAEMLSEMVSLNLYVMFETAGGEVIELRVPTPDPLLCGLAESHCAAVDEEEACASFLRATALFLNNQGLQPEDQQGTITRFTVTAVFQPELARIVSETYDNSFGEDGPAVF